MDSLPQNQYPSQSNKGKIIIIGSSILFLLIALLILNYFTATITLLPHRQSVQPPKISRSDQSSGISPTNNPLIQKAKSLGYEIIWMDPEDTLGRTIFYNWRGEAGYGGIGVREVKNPDGTTYTRHITGIFQRFEDIPQSKDKYLLLLDPKNNKRLPLVRLIFEQTPTKSSSGLAVEKLSVPLDVKEYGSEYIGTALEIGSNLEKILRSGDAVAVQLNTDGSSNFKNLKDKNGNFEVFFLFLRRFDGKIQIEKELGKV